MQPSGPERDDFNGGRMIQLAAYTDSMLRQIVSLHRDDSGILPETMDAKASWLAGGPWMHEAIARRHFGLLGIAGGRATVALDGDFVCGEIEVEPDDSGRLYLSQLMVSPKWRGKGIGRLLVENEIRLAVGKGEPLVVLPEVSAQPFYRKLGFSLLETKYRVALVVDDFEPVYEPCIERDFTDDANSLFDGRMIFGQNQPAGHYRISLPLRSELDFLRRDQRPILFAANHGSESVSICLFRSPGADLGAFHCMAWGSSDDEYAIRAAATAVRYLGGEEFQTYVSANQLDRWGLTALDEEPLWVYPAN